jgi:hypothetical protein
MSFPRKRESMRAAAFLDPRFRGGDKRVSARSLFCWTLEGCRTPRVPFFHLPLASRSS